MAKGLVLSLYDFTGEACIPWANDGYECYAYDIQHTGTMEVFPDNGENYLWTLETAEEFV